MVIQFSQSYFIPLEWVLSKIESADDMELSQIIQAIILRYNNVFPDCEVHFLSLPTDAQSKQKCLDLFAAFMKEHS